MMKSMTKKQKNLLLRIIAAAVMMVVFSLLPLQKYPLLRFVLFLIPYFMVGYDILRKALKGIKNRQVFDENFLMAVATVGAMVLGEYTEGVAVMLFYQIGELFQSYAVGKSRRNISELMDIRPDYANLETEDGVEEVDPDDIEIGSIILIKPGERVPIDGVIVEGTSSPCPHHKRIRGIYRFPDPGPGRKRQFAQSEIRTVYFQVCPLVHTCCLLQRAGTGGPGPACQHSCAA